MIIFNQIIDITEEILQTNVIFPFSKKNLE